MATIVDFADLKTMLGLTKDSFADYPDLELIADQVHDALEEFTGRKLDVVGSKKETGITIGLEQFISLTNLPLVSLSSVVIDGDTLTEDDYEISNYGLKLAVKRKGDWAVNSKGGFKPIPGVVYRAELSQIVYEYQNKNNLAAKSFTNDGGSVSLPGFVILNQVKDMLNSFTHVDKAGF